MRYAWGIVKRREKVAKELKKMLEEKEEASTQVKEIAERSNS